MATGCTSIVDLCKLSFMQHARTILHNGEETGRLECFFLSAKPSMTLLILHQAQITLRLYEQFVKLCNRTDKFVKVCSLVGCNDGN